MCGSCCNYRSFSLSCRSMRRRAHMPEAFNLFNRAQYGHLQNDITSPAFGQILITVNTGPAGTGTPRQLQLMLRLAF